MPGRGLFADCDASRPLSARFDHFRRILIRRFPYAVYFDHDDKEVRIYYVFHGAQNPDRLSERLGTP
jgi:plasmid stabilization system protein ParE